MAEAAFSDDGKYYSTITQDGRLRIWDTETNAFKQEYTPDLHLTSPPSCLQWICVSQSATPKGARRKSVSEAETQCVALGTNSGKILIYSVSQAKVETVLSNQNSDGYNNKITSLDWHKKYGLYSCNGDNYVYEWDLQSASVKSKYNVNVAGKNKQGNAVSAIKIVPHSEKTPAKFLVAASWQIRVWRLLNSEATVIKCLGHNTAPRALLTLASLKNTCWLIEGSQNERLLAFWDVTITEEHLPQQNGEEVTPSKRQRKKSLTANIVPTPTYNFVLEDAPRIVDVEVRAEGEGNRLRLAAATRSGVVHYYGHMLNGASSKPIKPSVTIQVTTADAHPLPLQCCRLPPSGDLVLGYTSGPALIFEKVTPDTKTKTQVLIRGDVSSESKKLKQNDVNKVRSDQRKEEVTYVEPMGGVSRKRPTPGGKVEVSMEARLANLALDVKSRSKSAVSQNLTKLLVQGLHSKDKGLILMVLQKDDPAVAARTVASLPADYVPQLLEQLADMATKKTSQCASVCTWLSAVLRSHSALLLATANAPTADHLTQLLAIFTHRRSHLCQLLNLKGRLQLAAAQRTERDTEMEDQEPILDYNDTSSEEEMEVSQYQSDSERSWLDDARSDDSGHEEND
ncbi:WD repeat-containing protein 43 [Epargyreus clarus]|uniref:WD repeat-containing protein 43 n=1 Tax=Epargyreus clarus TaxID=520877 RepID=UPI003C2CE58C